MPYTEAELAHEAERARFYDPLIIRQFRKYYESGLPVTCFESDEKHLSREYQEESLIYAGYSAYVGGFAFFAMSQMEMLQTDTRVLVSGGVACIVAFAVNRS